MKLPVSEERLKQMIENAGDDSVEAGVPTIDCRSQTGITIGLIDALISIARIVAERDLSGHLVNEALKDLRSDEDIKKVLGL